MEVVIIGAGPVGLWAAWVLSHQQPTWKIHVWEKRADYTRKQVVWIRKGYLKRACRGLTGAEMFQVWLQNLPVPVSIQQIEQELRQHCLSRHPQVQLHYEREYVGSASVLLHHPCATVWVGADGVHSTFRRTLFPPVVQQAGPWVLELRYNTENKVQQETSLVDKYAYSKLWAPYAVHEHIGKDSNRVTLRLIGVDHVVARNYREPSFMNAAELPEPIGQLFWRALQKRQHLVASPPGLIEVKAFPLDAHRNVQCAKMNHHASLFLLGDAALAVPYFQGLNYGLAHAAHWASQSHNHHPSWIHKYNSLMERESRKALSQVNWKTRLLQTWQAWLTYAKDHPLAFIE